MGLNIDKYYFVPISLVLRTDEDENGDLVVSSKVIKYTVALKSKDKKWKDLLSDETYNMGFGIDDYPGDLFINGELYDVIPINTILDTKNKKMPKSKFFRLIRDQLLYLNRQLYRNELLNYLVLTKEEKSKRNLNALQCGDFNIKIKYKEKE